jgi:hypothetical protein
MKTIWVTQIEVEEYSSIIGSPGKIITRVDSKTGFTQRLTLK